MHHYELVSRRWAEKQPQLHAIYAGQSAETFLATKELICSVALLQYPWLEGKFQKVLDVSLLS